MLHTNLNHRPYQDYVRVYCDTPERSRELVSLLDDLWEHDPAIRRKICESYSQKRTLDILYCDTYSNGWPMDTAYAPEKHLLTIAPRHLETGGLSLQNKKGEIYAPTLKELFQHELFHAADPDVNVAVLNSIFGLPGKGDGHFQRALLTVNHEYEMERARYASTLTRQGEDLLASRTAKAPQERPGTFVSMVRVERTVNTGFVHQVTEKAGDGPEMKALGAIVEKRSHTVLHRLQAMEDRKHAAEMAIYTDHPHVNRHIRRIETPAIEFANDHSGADRRTDYADGAGHVRNISREFAASGGSKDLVRELGTLAAQITQAGGLNGYLAEKEREYHQKLAKMTPGALVRLEDTPQAQVEQVKANGRVKHPTGREHD